MPLARIGLGCNVGNCSAQIEAALRALERLGHVVARSSFYRSKAWGVVAQDDFVNAAALVETDLTPRELLYALGAIEKELGRTTTFRWGPRTIDLDILAYDDVIVCEPDLVVPHQRLAARAFALAPLAEIDRTYAAAFEGLPAAERAAVQRIPVAAARREPAVNWEQVLPRVRSTAEFCASAGLARVRIEEGDFALDVRRAVRLRPDAEPVGDGDGNASANGAAPSSNGTVDRDEHQITLLRAEFVGIVRLSRPALTLGAVLDGDREIAYVESLGIRNPVRSGGPGRVLDVFVSDGQPVEYGQPLFAIEP